MSQAMKHPLELWWEDTDGGRVTVDRCDQSLDSFIGDLQQRGVGVRKIAEELEERTGGRVTVSHSTIHRWIQRKRQGLPLA